MNADIASGKWKQLKGEIQQRWGQLTSDDIDRINGSAEKFYGVLQERYGMNREQAEKEFKRLKH